MSRLVAIVPTRERSESVMPMATAFRHTCTADTRLVFVVDADDARLDDYRANVAIVTEAATFAGLGLAVDLYVCFRQPRSIVTALNDAVLAYLDRVDPDAVAFLGDDHRPRTVGWDRAYLDELDSIGGGFVYGNDCVQGQRLPTQIGVSAKIVRSLGYMAPPTLTHLYVDDWWLTVGRMSGRLRYLPDIVVQHCHPCAGTGVPDAGYERVNSQAMYDRDRAAFGRLLADGEIEADVELIRAALDG